MKLKKTALYITTSLAFAGFLTVTGSATANAATWKSGTPSVFKHTNQWVSDYTKLSKKEGHSYLRILTSFGAHYGYNPTPFYYNKHKKNVASGSDESATAAVNPHYQSLGKGYYKVTSGGEGSGKQSLSYELHQ